MALVSVDVRPDPRPVPEDVEAFLVDAGRRIEAFVEAHNDDPITGFVPSDFRQVWAVLEEVARRGLAPGELFCEWGSGYGVVAMLASRLDFHACGIEIVESLVESAQTLAEDHHFAVELVAGSFLPRGAEFLADYTNEFAWLRTDGPSGYDELELDIEDFDVVFAYPWPGEEHVLLELFERYASSGALLVTYEGVEEVRVRRKVR